MWVHKARTDLSEKVTSELRYGMGWGNVTWMSGERAPQGEGRESPGALRKEVPALLRNSRGKCTWGIVRAGRTEGVAGKDCGALQVIWRPWAFTLSGQAVTGGFEHSTLMM